MEDFISVYFDRIGFQDKATADFKTLTDIQRRHIEHIPFENLNPLLGLPVELSDDAIFRKLVISKRGGYCFEQNLLLKRVLKELGFNVRGLLGRAGVEPGSVGRTHMILLVSLDDKDYIVDTGYGGMVPTWPLVVQPDIVQQTPDEDFRLLNIGDEYRLEIFISGEWRRLYEFDLRYQLQMDYEVANWYTSTCPGSRFTNSLIVARTQDGVRRSLYDLTYSVYRNGNLPEKHRINSYAELCSILSEQFLIDLSGLGGLELIFDDLMKRNPQ